MIVDQLFNQFVVTHTGKTVSAIVLKCLFIRILLKVDCFKGFVNQSNIADFMSSKTSRCNFSKRHLYRHCFKHRYSMHHML